jgi:hypothetical protein
MKYLRSDKRRITVDDVTDLATFGVCGRGFRYRRNGQETISCRDQVSYGRQCYQERIDGIGIGINQCCLVPLHTCQTNFSYHVGNYFIESLQNHILSRLVFTS